MNRSFIIAGLTISSAILLHGTSGWTQDLPAVVGDDAIVTTPPRDPKDIERDKQDAERQRVDEAAWQEEVNRFAPVEKDNPQQAMDEYRRFFAAQPLHPAVGVEIGEKLGQLYLDGLKDPKQADTIYQWTLKTYDKAPNLYRLSLGRARLLNADGKFEEAAKILQPDLGAILKLDPFKDDTYAIPAIHELTISLTALKKPKDLIAALSQTLQQRPALLDCRFPEASDMYDQLTTLLIQEKRSDEAMGWARLRFAECVYDKDSIQSATQFLSKVWTAAAPTLTHKSSAGKATGSTTAVATTTTTATPNVTGLDGFVAAQKDPTLPNPLADFPLPAVPQGYPVEVLKPYYAAYYHIRISAFIAAGWYGDAMHEAEQILVREPDGKMAVYEATRVLKAADLNLKSAAALIKFMKSKEGVDPSAELYKRYPMQLVDGN